MGDAVVPVFSVAAEIAVEAVPHVNELLGDDHFQCPRLGAIDFLEVDEDRVLLHQREIDVGTTVAVIQATPDPAGKHGTLCGDSHDVTRQVEQIDVAVEVAQRLLVGDVQPHGVQRPSFNRRPDSGYHTLSDTPPTTGAEPPMSPRPTTVRPHVLVVSSDTDLAGFLTEGLLLTGFWASTVASAVQALEVFRLRSFDLILLDGALGGIGAVEALRRLRGTSDRVTDEMPRTDVPVIGIAASVEEADLPGMLEAGAEQVLVAPLELKEMAPVLLASVLRWRDEHPDRPWADQAVLGGA